MTYDLTLTFQALPTYIAQADGPEKQAVSDAVVNYLKSVEATAFRHLVNDCGFSVVISEDDLKPIPIEVQAGYAAQVTGWEAR